ncbi:MAG TPA: PAS domain-containing protein, partial [Rhodocyclaceae bacterium]|nr:PAS domain-containing protein [Rhodocyclaceae bacterium]
MATSDDPGANPPWRDSNAELRLLTDNVPAMILHLDRELYCRFANRRYVEFFGFGFGSGSLVGKHLREIVGDAAYREVERYFAQALEGRPVSYQRIVHHPSGEPRCIEVKLVPSLTEQGSVAGCYSLATDISEQKQVEQALRDAAAQLRTFADNVPAMTVSYDANLRCRFVNKRFAEFFGFTVEGMLGKHLREVVGEDAYREIERHFVLV